MTTDLISPGDRVARLEALHQRRATRPAGATQSAHDVPTTAARRQRARRRHAATGARILAGSLSAATALGLMGAMARATAPDLPAATTPQRTATPTVIVVRRPAGTTAEAAPPAPRVTPTTAAPVTTSRGS